MTRLVFVPSTPLLIPDLGVDSTPELDALRSAAQQAVVDGVRDAHRVVVAGPGPDNRHVAAPVKSSMAGFGVDLSIGDAHGTTVSWQAGLALWLLAEVGWQGPIDVVEVAAATDDADASTALRAALATDADQVALLCVGDGSAGLGPKSPGHVIDGAHEFDDQIAAALASGDGAALASLNSADGQRVMASGAPIWAAVGQTLPARWQAELRHRSAPLGVGYFVAVWT